MGYDFSRYEKKEGGYRIGVIASEMYMEMGTSFYWAMYQQVVYAASKSRSQTMLEILDTDMQRRDELPKLMRGKDDRWIDRYWMAFQVICGKSGKNLKFRLYFWIFR